MQAEKVRKVLAEGDTPQVREHESIVSEGLAECQKLLHVVCSDILNGHSLDDAVQERFLLMRREVEGCVAKLRSLLSKLLETEGVWVM